MRPRLPLATVLLCGLSSLAAGQSARSGRYYTLVELEAGSFTRATDVNRSGVAVGLVTEAGSGTQALRFGPGGSVVTLAPVLGTNALALGITRDGFVLGQSFSPSSSRATLWSPAGTPLGLPDLGWSLVEPAAISDAGVVVGRGYASGVWRPWIWDATNGTRLLSSLGFPAGANVTDVNSAGQLAGAPFFGEGFVFDLVSATSTSVGTLGGDSSSVIALNELGHAVGWSQTLPANERAPFFWSPATGMRSLGTPTGPGNVLGSAADLNRHGVVVGSYEPSPGVRHAFVWDAGVGFRDLNDVVRQRGGVELQDASHITATGWIAGNATDHSQGGKSIGYVLRPL